MSVVKRFERVSDLIEKIIQEEERYEAFLNASPWGIVVVDTKFNVVYANYTFQRMTGWSLEELVYKNLSIVIPEEQRAQHKKYEKIYNKSPKERIGNHGMKPSILRKDGSVFPVEISIVPGQVRGERFYFASVRVLESLYNTVDNGLSS